MFKIGNNFEFSEDLTKYFGNILQICTQYDIQTIVLLDFSEYITIWNVCLQLKHFYIPALSRRQCQEVFQMNYFWNIWQKLTKNEIILSNGLHLSSVRILLRMTSISNLLSNLCKHWPEVSDEGTNWLWGRLDMTQSQASSQSVVFQMLRKLNGLALSQCCPEGRIRPQHHCVKHYKLLLIFI